MARRGQEDLPLQRSVLHRRIPHDHSMIRLLLFRNPRKPSSRRFREAVELHWFTAFLLLLLGNSEKANFRASGHARREPATTFGHDQHGYFHAKYISSKLGPGSSARSSACLRGLGSYLNIIDLQFDLEEDFQRFELFLCR